ncbi:NAD(P)H-binding protein [Mycolicibacterium peregrinum]|uniref:NAD(P)-dependent oxidoreductase n=1 Tax=Mycobacteriaceae TaxID=1762 RepID=UPI0006D834BD|nr:MULTISPECIES: NAD(P)H-binding protein [Mycobacteriaceae]MCV7205632.1 NAD(P)H-binding protein [Mycolicibacterium peregrinum]ORW62548.1 NmrA family transcriptional regulator [Mycolicibacterium peregrinum]
MNITVFGGSGQIGRFVVTDLLAAGHKVTAYVRNPAKLEINDGALTTVTGELSDVERIRQAIHRADAVISALGPSLKRGAKGTPITEGTKNIAAAMTAENVSRYIGLATPSVPDERDQPTLKAKILPIMAGTMFPNALTELAGMTQAITKSGLNWTIARITRPTNGKPKGTVRAGFLGRDRVGSAMTRADIAAFLIAQLTDDRFSLAAPAISN